MKQAIAAWLVEHEIMWPVETSAPWWILTNYADQNDVMTLLDGAVMAAFSPHRPEFHSDRRM